MPLDYSSLPERFFSLFGNMTQAEISNVLFPGQPTPAKQSRISKWKLGKERIPMDVLAIVIDKYGVTWDWLLAGKTDSPQKEGKYGGDDQTGSGLAMANRPYLRDVMENTALLHGLMDRCQLAVLYGELPAKVYIQLLDSLLAAFESLAIARTETGQDPAGSGRVDDGA